MTHVRWSSLDITTLAEPLSADLMTISNLFHKEDNALLSGMAILPVERCGGLDLSDDEFPFLLILSNSQELVLCWAEVSILIFFSERRYRCRIVLILIVEKLP